MFEQRESPCFGKNTYSTCQLTNPCPLKKGTFRNQPPSQRAQRTPIRCVKKREGRRLCGHLTAHDPHQAGLSRASSRATRGVLTQSTWRTTAPCRLSSLVKMSLGNSCRAKEWREKTSSVQMTVVSMLGVWDGIIGPCFTMGPMNLDEKKLCLYTHKYLSGMQYFLQIRRQTINYSSVRSTWNSASTMYFHDPLYYYYIHITLALEWFLDCNLQQSVNEKIWKLLSKPALAKSGEFLGPEKALDRVTGASRNNLLVQYGDVQLLQPAYPFSVIFQVSLV